MQGQKGTIGSLSESLALEHGSSSSDSNVTDQQICWTNYMRHPQPNTNQESPNISMWSIGESSSSSMPNQVSQTWIDPKPERNWSTLMKTCPEHEPVPPSSMLSLGNVNRNIIHNHGPHNNVTVNPSTFIGIKPSNYASSSSSTPFELEGRQLPCKRKAESSSGIGSSIVFQREEGRSGGAWRLVSENPPPVNTPPSDQIIPRLGLGVGGVSSVENTQRNVRIRINNSRPQDPLPVSNNNINNNNGQLNHSSLYAAALRSPPVAATTGDNSLIREGQIGQNQPILRRNLQVTSRWNRSSGSRGNRSLNIADNSRTMPTNISDHSIFVQPRATSQSQSQTAINWCLNSGGGGNVSNNGNGSNLGTGPSSAGPNLGQHRGSPQLSSRRLELLRRSLLSSVDSGGVVGGQNSNLFSRLPPPVGGTSRDVGIPPVAGIIPGHHHVPHSRSSNRLVDGGSGFPYLARSVAAGNGSEGRGRLVSEIRNVLDMIRRGEGLRIEDVMILDQSMFYGMADIHDRHRDMRLDIDNMSYEELLALEERIGNVNTGLTEDKISSCLKQKTHMTTADTEPCCCICQEEYKNGDGVGGLECGHDFHTGCIKQWLSQKNECPVCKSAAATK